MKRPQPQGPKSYTRLDEMLADPVRPCDPKMVDYQIALAQGALAAIRPPAAPDFSCWSVMCIVSNTMQTFLRQGIAADPDGLLNDAMQALKAGLPGLSDGGGYLPLTDGQFAAVGALIEDWTAIMRNAPARSVIRCMRATERRIADIKAGRLPPDDYTLLMIDAKAMPAPKASKVAAA